jgi:hypothetical protein
MSKSNGYAVLASAQFTLRTSETRDRWDALGKLSTMDKEGQRYKPRRLTLTAIE